MDAVPGLVDHATLGAAPWGRNGWGVALLMRDVADELVPVGDEPVTEEVHLAFLEDRRPVGGAAMNGTTISVSPPPPVGMVRQGAARR